MEDQARQLRQLVCRQTAAPAPQRAAGPRLLVASGGKGGVGTTTVAANLAVALARQGYRLALVDADPHSGDLALRCRLPERETLADVLSGQKALRQALQPGPAGVLVLPGAAGLGDLADCSSAVQERFVQELQGLGDRADCIVIDAGSGMSRLVRRFWQAADLVLAVTSPELDSVMAVYGSIKALAAGDDRIPIGTLVTMAAAAEAAGVHARLARACQRFLGLPLRSVGHVLSDAQIARDARAAALLVDTAANGPAGAQLERVAQTVAVEARLPRAERAEPKAQPYLSGGMIWSAEAAAKAATGVSEGS